VLVFEFEHQPDQSIDCPNRNVRMFCEPLKKSRFNLMLIGCLCFAPWLTGCGGDSDLADVRGVVTLDGQPLPKAFVSFTPQGSGGTVTFGKTAEDGSYRMFFTDDEPGAYIGSNLVSISTGDVTVKEVVPTAYNSQSELLADVVAGKNEFNYDLKSDASSVKQVLDRDR